MRTAATESLANVVETVGVKIYPREGGWTVGDIDNSRPHNATQDLVRACAVQNIAIERVGGRGVDVSWPVGGVDVARGHNSKVGLFSAGKPTLFTHPLTHTPSFPTSPVGQADHVIPMLLEVIRSDERVQPAWKGCHGIASLAKGASVSSIFQGGGVGCGMWW